jgi:hypothetical protein
MGTPPGWGLEHRTSNPVSVKKNLTAIETSTIVKLLRPYVPVGMKRTSNSSKASHATNHSKDTFVNISPCTGYNFSALMPVVWKL